MTITEKQRGGERIVYLSADVRPTDDIMGGRTQGLRLRFPNRGNRPFDKVPHFSMKHAGTGMGFPEVLRAYAELFNFAADLVEAKEPIDFQI